MPKRLFVVSLVPVFLLGPHVGGAVLLVLTTLLVMQGFRAYVRHCVAYRESQLKRPQRGYLPLRRGLL